MGRADILSCGLVLALTVASFAGLGAISAEFTLLFKRGDPVSGLVGGLSRFLGGVYFPVAIFPGWLQKVSYLLPLTHSLEAMRLALLKGASVSALRTHLAVLALFAVVLTVSGLAFFRMALRKAMKDGSLPHI